LVEEFTAAGWDVVALVRTPDHTARLPVSATVVVGDVRDDTIARILLQEIGNRQVDVLINNAVQGAAHEDLGAIDVATLANSFDVNVAGPLRVCLALLPNLLAAPDPVIVNVTSRLGSLSAQARGDFADLQTSYAYRVSKAAQNMLTICLANDLAGQVRCWAVHPGALDTTMGQPTAAKSAGLAAQQLRALVDSGDPSSPRFCSLGEADRDW
jgi:NAD(P)-dependent dehydrogenase (short-subunit alcohol dehydrogenase family)